jgi:hypothetical protein
MVNQEMLERVADTEREQKLSTFTMPDDRTDKATD